MSCERPAGKKPTGFAGWDPPRRPASASTCPPANSFTATWSILLPADYGLQRLLGWDARPNVSFWVELARSLRPYLFVLPATLIAHAVFGLLGSRPATGDSGFCSWGGSSSAKASRT